MDVKQNVKQENERRSGENCSDNKVNQLSKVLEKEEEGGITGLATTIHQVNPNNRRMEGRNDKQMKP